jgi:hypothetical protein
MSEIINPGTLAIIRETARQTAEEVIDRHRRDCPITDVKVALFGNGRDGIKADVIRIDTAVEALTEAADKVAKKAPLWKPVLAHVAGNLIVLFVCWMMFIYAQHAPAVGAQPAPPAQKVSTP